MAKNKPAPPTPTLELPCNFGGVSIGDKTARIGVTIDRSKLKIASADKNLCGKRLTGRIEAMPAGGNADQPQLFEDKRDLEGVFDVKGFSVNMKNIGIGLTFAIADLDIATLGHFAKRAGRLVVLEVGDIPDDVDDEEEDADGEPDADAPDADPKKKRRAKKIAKAVADATHPDHSDKDL